MTQPNQGRSGNQPPSSQAQSSASKATQPTASASSQTSSTGQAGQSGSPVEQVKQQAQQATDQVVQQGQQAISTAGEQVRQQVTTQVQSQKDRAAEGLGSVALALRQTSQHLREQGQAPVAGYFEQGAERVENLSGYLRQHDVDEVVAEVEGYARRQPLVFLGAAFGLGFLAARFFRSSSAMAGPMGMGQTDQSRGYESQSYQTHGYQSQGHRGQQMTAGTSGTTGGTPGSEQGGDVFEQSIEVDVPIQIAYGQWTQFESFPQFMQGVEEVRQQDAKTLHWRAQIAGKTEEWNATIVEQVPDQRIAWRSTTGARNDGRVSFQVVNPNMTRVTLQLYYKPEGVIENVGSMLGFVQQQVRGDLERFKRFIESRGAATGAWRGEVHGSTVTNRPQ